MMLMNDLIKMYVPVSSYSSSMFGNEIVCRVQATKVDVSSAAIAFCFFGEKKELFRLFILFALFCSVV